jgi:DNA-binding transcriptional regulator LsrR (DeoR family)
MGCSVANIKRHLRNAEKKAPQLFPILTPRHRAILALYDERASRAAIAEDLGISKAVLGREVTFLRKHGYLFNRTMDQYDPSMDGEIKEKF